MTAWKLLGGFCAFLMIAISAIAQPDSLWSRTFGGSSTDWCWSVQQTTDDGYILGGFTNSYGAGSDDFWLVKTDANGDNLWSHTFGGSNIDWCYSVQQTADGGYILGGYTHSYGAGNADFWLVKTDYYGRIVWSRTFGGSSTDICHSVQQTTDGGYILGGHTRAYPGDDSDFWLVKTDTNGDSLWSRTFGGCDHDRCRSVQQTTDGGYVLGGTTESFGAGGKDFWLVKVNANGIEEWNHAFGGSRADDFHSVQQTTDGGYILGGRTDSFVSMNCDFWLVKVNANGDSVWSNTFGGDSWESCRSVQQTYDGGYILGGCSYSYGQIDRDDFFLVKADSNGVEEWSLPFRRVGNDECYSVQQTTDGGYVLAGYTASAETYSRDFWLVKTGPDPKTPEEIFNPIRYTLYQNYPNPFNPLTQITFEQTKPNHVSLKVFDVLGREVATLAYGRHSAGTHHIVFDGSNLPSGMYFCRLEAWDFIQTKKMVLLK